MTFSVLCGDSAELVKNIKPVDTVVTSPPYWGKRHYGDIAGEVGRGGSDEYIKSLVDIFNSIPLKPRGSLWVNLGDKRASSGSLTMLPERFALEMLRTGWLLADSVVWAKVVDFTDGTTTGSCMVEPAPGRLNGNGYEMLYRFVKTKTIRDAYSDTCAVRIPRQGVTGIRYLPGALMNAETDIEGRNLHNVWRIDPGRSRNKHYAVYPPELCERPIAMTCPREVCVECGAPVVRIIEMTEYDEMRGSKRIFGKYTDSGATSAETGRMDHASTYIPRKPVTIGWKRTCDHSAVLIPGVVLDPFSGTGTTGQVALKMGRNYIGIDLYQKFCDIAEQRLKALEAKL